jgi:hypothetical protein
MGRKRSYSITELKNKTGLFSTALPFDVTSYGEVIATVISPRGAQWRVCEKCGENTQNIIEYQDKKGGWQRIILCDKCSNELL